MENNEKFFNLLYSLWLSCDGNVGKFHEEMDKVENKIKDKLRIEKGKQEKK